GEGLGNQFLGHIRSVDAIAHVVRCFDDPDVVHVHGGVDSLRDIEVIDTELALADLDSVTKAILNVEKKAKASDAESLKPREIYKQLEKHWNDGKTTRSLGLSPEESALIKDLFLLTSKPVLYVGNVSEADIHKTSPAVEALKAHAKKEGAEV